MATAAGQTHEPSWLDDRSAPEPAHGSFEPDHDETPVVGRASFGPFATTALSLALFVPQLVWIGLLAYITAKLIG